MRLEYNVAHNTQQTAKLNMNLQNRSTKIEYISIAIGMQT